MAITFDITAPLSTFYHRCVNEFHLGDQTLYDAAKTNRVGKFCFNPYLSTECDVQLKLGSVIDEYIRKNNLPFSVNTEMKVYDSKRDRADLSIHRIEDGMMYTSMDSHISNLEWVIEIKFANAVRPEYEYEKHLVHRDIAKLSHHLPPTVRKAFVLIDEADGASAEYTNYLINACKENNILLFSNNYSINGQLGFPYKRFKNEHV